MKTLLQKLRGGDLRSIGRANEVARSVGENRQLFDEVFLGIFDEDPIVRSRSADAIEKASKRLPHFLQSHKKTIIARLQEFHQQEVRWHIALMLGSMKLTQKEVGIVIDVLLLWLHEDKSKIVKVNCLQALADIAQRNSWFANEVVKIIEEQMPKGSPAVKARGRKLLKQLQKA